MKTSPPYHRVNLRKTLLDAAVALIGEVGPRAFTLREVARRAGVSHNAPYRHFAGKDELLRAVATEGFERLAASMEKALGPGRTAAERLQLCGCGYVEFALKWPQHLLVMFDMPPVDTEQCKPDQEAGGPAFQVLMDCILAAQEAGDLPAGDPMPEALMSWALVHGIAKLATGGNLPLTAEATVEFARSAAAMMLGRMGSRAGA